MRSYRLLFAAFVLVWTGCRTDVYYDTLQSSPPVPYFTFSLDFPPKIFLRPDTNTILIINRVELSKQQLPRADREVVKAGAYSSLKYAAEQLAMRPHVRVINLIDSANFKVSTDSLTMLFAKYHANYTLALVQYGVNTLSDSTYSGLAYSNKPIDIKLTTYRVDVKLTMYIDGGGLYKNISGSATVQRRQQGLGLDGAEPRQPSMSESENYVIGATKNAALKALVDYFPYTDTESRPLYVGPKLGAVADAIIAGEFDKASRLSQRYLNDRDPVVACQAAYNLAVVYEAQGYLDKATDMARLALTKSKSRYANALLTYLRSK